MSAPAPGLTAVLRALERFAPDLAASLAVLPGRGGGAAGGPEGAPAIAGQADASLFDLGDDLEIDLTFGPKAAPAPEIAAVTAWEDAGGRIHGHVLTREAVAGLACAAALFGRTPPYFAGRLLLLPAEVDGMAVRSAAGTLSALREGEPVTPGASELILLCPRLGTLCEGALVVEPDLARWNRQPDAAETLRAIAASGRHAILIDDPPFAEWEQIVMVRLLREQAAVAGKLCRISLLLEDSGGPEYDEAAAVAAADYRRAAGLEPLRLSAMAGADWQRLLGPGLADLVRSVRNRPRPPVPEPVRLAELPGWRQIYRQGEVSPAFSLEAAAALERLSRALPEGGTSRPWEQFREELAALALGHYWEGILLDREAWRRRLAERPGAVLLVLAACAREAGQVAAAVCRQADELRAQQGADLAGRSGLEAYELARKMIQQLRDDVRTAWERSETAIRERFDLRFYPRRAAALQPTGGADRS